jgi:hypothetical protein
MTKKQFYKVVRKLENAWERKYRFDLVFNTMGRKYLCELRSIRNFIWLPSSAGGAPQGKKFSDMNMLDAFVVSIGRLVHGDDDFSIIVRNR